MGKVYEALEHAQQKQKGSGDSFKILLPGDHIAQAPKTEIVGTEEELISLYQVINSLLTNSQKKVIQFISSRNGEGTSTLAREFAEIVASTFDISTLLLDANPQTCQTNFFGDRPVCGWDEVIQDGKPIKDALCQVGESRMYTSQVMVNENPLTSIIESSGIDKFFEELKQDFEFIIIDSPSATVSTDGIALSNKVDGVILVVEAENTRWQVAHAVKERIVKRGGNILGVILNKKKYYIPKLIYELL